MSEPLRATITYCAECGYEPQALETAGALMVEFGTRLAAVELIPWADGTFDVRIGGRLVHSMTRDGGFPATGDLILAAHEILTAR